MTNYECILSCYALCRVIIEVCLQDKLKKKGYLKPKKVIDYSVGKDDSLNHYIYLAKNKANLLDQNSHKIIKSVQKRANAVLHGNIKNKKPDSDDITELIKDTVTAVEMLYS